MRHFGACCLQELQEQATFPVALEDIQWVITVPAIWRQSAKQFMRHAALQVSLQYHTVMTVQPHLQCRLYLCSLSHTLLSSVMAMC